MSTVVVMGVSGSGKSTVGRALAQRLGGAFGEGDDLHPAANVQKMADGHPLGDADRWPWLTQVRSWITTHSEDPRPAVITCSALKRRYRDLLREPGVVFVYLHGTRELLLARLSTRQGHFMPTSLLDSQLADLEPPGPDEQAIAVRIDEPVAVQMKTIVDALAS